MKVEIEITEEDAACIWANTTWDGKTPKTIEEILASKAKVAADRYRLAFGPQAVVQALEGYRRHHPQI